VRIEEQTFSSTLEACLIRRPTFAQRFAQRMSLERSCIDFY